MSLLYVCLLENKIGWSCHAAERGRKPSVPHKALQKGFERGGRGMVRIREKGAGGRLWNRERCRIMIRARSRLMSKVGRVRN